MSTFAVEYYLNSYIRDYPVGTQVRDILSDFENSQHPAPILDPLSKQISPLRLAKIGQNIISYYQPEDTVWDLYTSDESFHFVIMPDSNYILWKWRGY